MRERLNIATACLASCTGCHMALVDLGEDFLSLVSSSNLVFSPVLVDSKAVAAADLALVEGGVRTEEDLHLLKELRSQAKILVALGTCAAFGGVPGLADTAPREQLMVNVYGQDDLGADVPAALSRLLPIDSFVDVDYYLPGCPPPPDHISSVLASLLTGSQPPRIETPVCSECDRKAGPEPLQALVRPFSTQPLPEKCLLVQGIVCLGSVTRGGCGAACTSANVPCRGCRGPTDHVLLESRHGVYRDIVHRISHLLDMSINEVEQEVTDLSHLFYSYSLASPTLRRKNAERVSRLVYRVKV